MARILVMDAASGVRKLLRSMLSDIGHEVIDAADGFTGMRYASIYEVDLVIVDVLLPGKDGIEVILELQEERPNLHVIAIAGGGRGLDAGFLLQVALDFGASQTLAKPFSTREVLEVVDQGLM
ncbi:response regulator [Magnetococcales bacterium HHB-1]